ncbi:serine hydrolase domain-containing protein [Sulfurovum sp. CS9]|uniref:serine hydrolase domain-containing protein n=1 Tax=Sulfurovum sp. CS9 TaxID=3391146 RepID=UPI0039E8E8A4
MNKIFKISIVATSFLTFAVHQVNAGDAKPNSMDKFPTDPAAQVTLMNFFHPPYNEWAFRNAGVQSTLMVPRGGDIVMLPSKANTKIAALKFEWDGKPYTVRNAMVGDHTDGIIVIKGGEIAYEEYFGDFTERDQHIWASSTKSLIGMSTGILVAQGKLDVSKKVGFYLPELRDKYFGQRTVRQVLNMISALGYIEDYENFTPVTISTEYIRRLGLVPAFDLMTLDPKKDDTPRGLRSLAARFKGNPNLKPGEKFEYHSPNVDIIGWLINRITGKPLQTFIADNVWNKLGVEHDAFFLADTEFKAMGTGGFNTTLRDAARVGLAVLNNGAYNGHQVFPEKWVKDTFTLSDADRLHVARSSFKDKEGSGFDPSLEGYKNFLWVHDSKKKIATFRGVFGQMIYINQDADVVIATFSSALRAANGSRETNKPRMAAFKAIADYLKK